MLYFLTSEAAETEAVTETQFIALLFTPAGSLLKLGGLHVTCYAECHAGRIG